MKHPDDMNRYESSLDARWLEQRITAFNREMDELERKVTQLEAIVLELKAKPAAKKGAKK